LSTIDAVVRPYVFENLHYGFKTKNLIRRNSLLIHKTSSSFSGLVTARAEINSSRNCPGVVTPLPLSFGNRTPIPFWGGRQKDVCIRWMI